MHSTATVFICNAELIKTCKINQCTL